MKRKIKKYKDRFDFDQILGLTLFALGVGALAATSIEPTKSEAMVLILLGTFFVFVAPVERIEKWFRTHSSKNKHQQRWIEIIGWLIVIISGTLLILRILGIILD